MIPAPTPVAFCMACVVRDMETSRSMSVRGQWRTTCIAVFRLSRAGVSWPEMSDAPARLHVRGDLQSVVLGGHNRHVHSSAVAWPMTRFCSILLFKSSAAG